MCWKGNVHTFERSIGSGVSIKVELCDISLDTSQVHNLQMSGAEVVNDAGAGWMDVLVQ